MLDCGRKKVNQLHGVISNRDINLSARRLLLLSVVRPSLEYGSELWEGNKSQAAAPELGGGKRILGCSSKTCGKKNVCVREVSLKLVSFTHLMNVCGSAYENWCVVDGMCAMAAD